MELALMHGLKTKHNVVLLLITTMFLNLKMEEVVVIDNLLIEKVKVIVVQINSN